MADSFFQGTTDGTTRVFAVPFPYIRQADVGVFLNGIELFVNSDYLWIGPSSIQINGTPGAGNTIEILRQTSPDGPLVSFQNGAVLTGADLNTAVLQAFYRTQELQDQLNTYITGGVAKYSVGGANPAVSPQALLDAAAAAALDSNLAQTLLNASNDISLNAQSLLAQTSRVDTLQATLDALTADLPGGIGTFLLNEQTSRINGDQALATTIALMGAVSGDGLAFVLDEATVMVDGTTSLADKLSGIESTLAGNVAAIATEQTTRATADSATATSISSLTTVVDGHTTSISSQLSSINGLEGQFTLRIDADGNVAGFGLAAGGGAPSEFTVLANKFSVIDPGAPGGTPTVPFTISGGVVFMQNVVIGDALISQLQLTKLTSGTLNADMNIGTGHVIFDNGAFMQVTGVGFGSLNQFIEWFGPHVSDFSSCTEANAISYKKIDGSAFFGGTLLAGKLANSVQGTVLDTTNVADLGPFSSNGNTITITASYNFRGHNAFPGTTAGLNDYNNIVKQNPAATITLSRSINGGAFVDVVTQPFTGSHNELAPQPADVAPGFADQTLGGSFTFVDTAHVAQNREYRLRINSLTNLSTTTVANTLSLQSIE